MTGFADQLFDDLMRDYGTALDEAAPPASPGRRVSRPVWMTAGALAAVGATAGGLVLASGGSAAAFAVTRNADGSTSITLDQPAGIDGANDALRALGDRVVVVPVHPGCPTVASLPKPHTKTPATLKFGSDGKTITVSARDVSKGDLALVGELPAKGGGLDFILTVISGPAPRCVSMPIPEKLP